MLTSDYLRYQVGEFSTTNKLTAIEQANGNLEQVHFYFADDAHSNHDWTVEPAEHINDLIDQRILQLRDQYGYVALWYSGGYDSQTILDGFLRTNTRLDEVLIYHRKWIDHAVNQEEKVAYRYATYVKKNFQPWLKIRVVEYDPDAIFDFYKHYGSDWIYNEPGSFPGFTKQNRANTARWQKEFQRLQFQPGRIDINGVDKPRLNLYQNNWYSQMADNTVNYYFDCKYDLFYISPEATKLYIKQCWLAIKWMEQQPDCSHKWVHSLQSNGVGPEVYQQWNRAVGRSSCHDPLSAGGAFKFVWYGGIHAPESQKLITATRTQDSKVYKAWHNGIQYLDSKYGQSQLWSPTNGFKSLLSNPIFIKQANLIGQDNKII